jgi:hypothetical protein
MPVKLLHLFLQYGISFLISDMPLESLTDAGSPNLRTLALEDPVAHKGIGLFDPKRDLQESDWQMLQDDLEDMHFMGHAVGKMVIALNTLGRRPQTDERHIQALEKDLTKCRDKGGLSDDWATGMTAAAGLRLLGGDPRITEQEWPNIIRHIEYCMEYRHDAYFGEKLHCVVLLGGRERLLKKIKIQKLIGWYRKLEKDVEADLNIVDFAAALRLLEPSIQIKRDYHQVREEMGKWKEPVARSTFAKAASYLAILSAKDVYVADQDVQLVFPKSPTQIDAPFPAVRKFYRSMQ